MKTLIDFIKEHPVCLQRPSRRVARTAKSWSERVRLESASRPGERPLPEYPRPQLERSSYTVLNGRWRYGILSCAEYLRREGKAEAGDGEILVPFSPECDLSGVGRILAPQEVLLYETVFGWTGQGRLLLHFEAVDQVFEVRVNGQSLGLFEGTLPVSMEGTGSCRPGENRLEVHVADLTDEGTLPRGKQSFSRGGIWYTPQSGIWGTVWTEEVPEDYIRDVECFPDPDLGQVNIRVETEGSLSGIRIEVTDPEGRTQCRAGQSGDNLLKLDRRVLWSPDHPALYGVRVLGGEDEVRSYFALRKVELARDVRGHMRVKLNGEFLFQSGVLDQGYYPESLLTPPSDAAMILDILSMKERGFNLLRKHIKVEPSRWYYHCDRLGMLVWQDMVSGGGRYRLSVTAVLPFLGIRLDDRRYAVFGRKDPEDRRAYREYVGRTVRQLRRFPCIVQWCLFNEGWGQFDSAEMTRFVRELDPTRLIDSVSGWHDKGTQAFDFRSVHCYFRKFRMPKGDRCVILSEFGGYSLAVAGHRQMPRKFGYRFYADPAALRRGIRALYEKEILPAVEQGLCAAVYTQLSDVEEELNGLLTYDRKVDKTGKALFSALNRQLMEACARAVKPSGTEDLGEEGRDRGEPAR